MFFFVHLSAVLMLWLNSVRMYRSLEVLYNVTDLLSLVLFAAEAIHKFLWWERAYGRIDTIRAKRISGRSLREN